MNTAYPGNWFLIDGCAVDGLGQGELLQSAATPSEFKASLILNNYESNCLRDWLAQRWAAKSLEQTCVFEADHSKLIISLAINANNAFDAKEKFESWLARVFSERESASNSRR